MSKKVFVQNSKSCLINKKSRPAGAAFFCLLFDQGINPSPLMLTVMSPDFRSA